MTFLWFWPLLKFAAGPALLVWWFRAWWMAPWGIYVSHERIKTEKGRDGAVFMTVRRVRWYPPFAHYDERWHRRRLWVRESDGKQAKEASEVGQPLGHKLTNMLEAAEDRVVLTEETMK